MPFRLISPLSVRTSTPPAQEIHVDGLIKMKEIYNIFDTEKILGRPISIIITDKSGLAGVVHWLNKD